jgi:hypothetical protein
LQCPLAEQTAQPVSLPLQLLKVHVPAEQVCVVQVSVEQEVPFFEASGVDVQVPSPTYVDELPPHAACWHAPGVTPGHVGTNAIVPSVSTSR